ncbi:MAG: SDR family oxidoreductase [Deltaproteobacteria bacterium]|nr:SDR family oxidoreductase [Deltaproteobacteria bacterium]
MKILVLGGEGMLGHKMVQKLRTVHPGTACTIRGRVADPFYAAIDLFAASRVLENFDAMNLHAVRNLLAAERPEWVVNCIGIIKQRSAAELPVPSITLNALLPHVLADELRPWGGRLIHVSTDCVFSGRRGNYTEDDAPDAEDLYGRSKFLGEAREPNALTLRTSIIGRELRDFRSLLEWFLAQRGRTIRGFRRVIYSGVTTNHLADVVARLVAGDTRLSGLYHVASAPLSKYELLCLARDAFRIDVGIEPDDGEVSDRSLVGARFEHDAGYRCPDWSELLRDLAADPTPYGEWRSHVASETP